jgi:polysaccharide export outer membrane protein
MLNRCTKRGLITCLLGAMTATLIGCEADSYLDPTLVGRWERTPVTMPILERLELRGSQQETPIPITPVRADDLIPDVQEYTIGPGDLITVSTFELIQVGVTDVQNRVIDETGRIRLPVIGEVKASGYTPSQLEDRIIEVLEQKGIMSDATVSVVVQQSRQNLYSIIGAPEEGSTRFGTYLIPQPDFRLLEALALAGGVSGRTKRILIFRQTALTPEVAGETTEEEGGNVEPAPRDSSDLIEELLDEGGPAPSGSDSTQPEDRPAAPAGVESGLDSGTTTSPRWVYIDGKFVRVDGNSDVRSVANAGAGELDNLIAQRILEVPYERLINGDMRYNVVIRPGDTIKIPDQAAGFVYIMGQTNRPGAYTVPGERDLTLKQLIASSGGLGQLANATRVDLIRRVGDDQEMTVRLDLAAIFHGNEPDIFLRPDDLINIGSSGVAAPLAVIRNGFRFTYGFGFILDRNFGPDVFGERDRF